MDWEDKRKQLAAQPLDGWWDRTALTVQDALNTNKCTCCTQTRFGGWLPDRQKLHQEIINDHLALTADLPRDRKAVVTGGIPGAGKTRIIHSHGYTQDYAVVDADVFKAELVLRGAVEDVEGLTPLETGVLTHVETTQIAKQYFHALGKRGTNIVWDFTMSNSDSVQTRVNYLRSKNYAQITSLFVRTAPDVARARVRERHQQGVEAFLAGEGLGGRYVPFSHINFRAPEQCYTRTLGLFNGSDLVDNNQELKVASAGT